MARTAPAVQVVQLHHVERHARRAIGRRLGYAAPRAVIGVNRDPDRREAVILHLNSGGNASAASVALRAAGYRVEDTNYDPFQPGHYGVRLRVLPTTATGLPSRSGDRHE